MNDLALLEEHQLDALREVANIGAGHAATALSIMINATVMITVPRISVSRLADMPSVVTEADEPVAAVLLHMLGDLTGRTLLVFSKEVAVRLAEMLLRREPGSSTEFGKLEQSAINEVGNVLSSAYMNALSAFMGMILLPTPPTLSVETSRVVLTNEHLKFASDEDQVFCVDSEFLVQGMEAPLRGFFLLMPDAGSLATILRTIQLK
jgi:chemotaxis protein CheC